VDETEEDATAEVVTGGAIAAEIRDNLRQKYWLRSFSRDWITPVRNEMTWTSLISSGVKERHK